MKTSEIEAESRLKSFEAMQRAVINSVNRGYLEPSTGKFLVQRWADAINYVTGTAGKLEREDLSTHLVAGDDKRYQAR